MYRRLLSFGGLVFLVACAYAQDSGIAQGPREAEVVYFATFVPGNKLVTVGSPVSELQPVCCSVFNGKLLSIWDVASGKRLEQRMFEEDLESTAASPNGKLLASWNAEECDHFADGAIRLYRIDPADEMFGVTLGSFGGPTCLVSEVVFSPDSKYMAAT